MKPKAALYKIISKSCDNFRRRDSDARGHRKSLNRLHNLERLAMLGEWEEWEEHFYTGDESAKAHCFSFGDSMLHMVCRFHPPVSIVRKVLKTREPFLAVQEVNSLGQTPLHVAAACGASYKVVLVLLEQSAIPAMVQDSEGNTPLHLHLLHCSGQKICDPGFTVPNLNSSTGSLVAPSNSVRSTASTAATSKSSSVGSLAQVLSHRSNSLSVSCHSEDDFALKSKTILQLHKHAKDDVEHVKLLVQGPTYEIVQYLANAAPECLLLENDDDYSAVELAILCEADLKTVTKLQSAARQHLKSLGGSTHRGKECEDEFSSILPHHKVVWNCAA